MSDHQVVDRAHEHVGEYFVDFEFLEVCFLNISVIRVNVRTIFGDGVQELLGLGLGYVREESVVDVRTSACVFDNFFVNLECFLGVVDNFVPVVDE